MNNENNNKYFKKQNSVFLVVGCVVILLFALFCHYCIFEKDVKEDSEISKGFDLPVDKVKLEEMWMTRFEGENKALEQKLNYMESLMTKELEGIEKYEEDNLALQREISSLRKSLQEVSEKTSQKEMPKEMKNVSFSDPMTDYFEEVPKRKSLKHVVSEPQREKVMHVDEAIPGGTSVRAVLVSSVDIPCSVHASSDPQPVKLQILDDSRLPNSVRVKLKGGILIASAYGDLSSERVIVRTERLTQTQPDGSFVETEVTGYISGEDGKYGIRGTVVDKSYKMVENAAVSGFFSGVNQVLERHGREYTSIEVPSQSNTLTATGVLKSGGFGGMNNAFDRLTDYYIRRAEQVRPVLQVNAGRIVDVTFTHYAETGDFHTKERVQKIRSENRKRVCP